jgi:protein-disulfide isomerase
MPEHECEECGEEFDSERGLHIHQSQVHKENDDKEEKNEETNENNTAISLTASQLAGVTFIAGIILGLAIGLFVGGGSGSSPGVVELSSSEYPFEGIEAGVGEGERTFDNITHNISGEPYIGSQDAQVTMISYEDFQCPFCGRYNNGAFPQIVENHISEGEAQYFFKNLPLTRRHPWALPSAIASECALNQDAEAFWTFKKGFFDKQKALGNAYDKGKFDESMYRWAEQTGLDVNQFRQCYNNQEEREEVREDRMEASNTGASATPSIFVNDELIQGAQPYSIFQSTIESKIN